MIEGEERKAGRTTAKTKVNFVSGFRLCNALLIGTKKDRFIYAILPENKKREKSSSSRFLFFNYDYALTRFGKM